MKVSVTLVLVILIVVLLLALFFLPKFAEEFQSATGPQILCAIEYAKANPTSVSGAALKAYINAFDVADARKKQNLATDANFVYRKVMAEKMYGPLNTYYQKVRGQKSILNCMQQTYAIGKRS